MERHMIISMIAGYTVALLPVWKWDSKVELILATIISTMLCLFFLIWAEERIQTIKKALTSGNVKTSER